MTAAPRTRLSPDGEARREAMLVELQRLVVRRRIVRQTSKFAAAFLLCGAAAVSAWLAAYGGRPHDAVLAGNGQSDAAEAVPESGIIAPQRFVRTITTDQVRMRIPIAASTHQVVRIVSDEEFLAAAAQGGHSVGFVTMSGRTFLSNNADGTIQTDLNVPRAGPRSDSDAM